jgi:LysM repeat protein
MKLHKYIIFLSFALLWSGNIPLLAQPPGERISKKEYIDRYKEIAIREMNAFHIPASITLAQGILESAHGNSRLAKIANNHFGIKCHKGWSGGTFYMDDDAKNECFRKYKNPETSYKDHSKFLSTRDRYAFLFNLKISDYKSWANGLKKAGYATNPKYPQLLIKIIEEHKLYEYDKFYGKKYTSSTNNGNNRGSNTSFSKKEYEEVANTKNDRRVFLNNGIKFIYTRKGDTFYKIARDFNIYKYQIYKYNDLKRKDILAEGQMLYLESKKNKCNKSVHTVRPGETLFDISQEYGIRLKKLAKYNNLKKDARLYPDQKIKLKR